MMSIRLSIAAAALLLISSNVHAQVCVGGPKLGPSMRTAYVTGSLEFTEPGAVAGATVAFARQDGIVAGVNLGYSALMGEGDFSSLKLGYLFGPVVDPNDEKGWCGVFSLAGANLSDFDNAGVGIIELGGSYGMERSTSVGTLVPFGSLLLGYSDYAGTLDIDSQAQTFGILEGGAGLRLTNGAVLSASLRTTTVENSDIVLRVAGSMPFMRRKRE